MQDDITVQVTIIYSLNTENIIISRGEMEQLFKMEQNYY